MKRGQIQGGRNGIEETKKCSKYEFSLIENTLYRKLIWRIKHIFDIQGGRNGIEGTKMGLKECSK